MARAVTPEETICSISHLENGSNRSCRYTLFQEPKVAAPPSFEQSTIQRVKSSERKQLLLRRATMANQSMRTEMC